MKKISFLFSICFFTLLSYTYSNENIFPDYICEEYIEILMEENIGTIQNNELHTFFEEKFSVLFDKVDRIDSQYSKQVGYYYLVFGKHKGESKIELFKVDKPDIINEKYTYIDFSDNPNGFSSYCVLGSTHWIKPCPWSNNECKPKNSNCIGLICSAGCEL